MYYADGEPEELMVQVGLEPLVPYPGFKVPWRARCLRCGTEVAPWFNDVRRGGGCRHCNWTGRAWVPDDEARAVMRAANLQPQVPYPGASEPWPCVCLTCGAEVAPRLSKVRDRVKHERPGCRYCVRRPRPVGGDHHS